MTNQTRKEGKKQSTMVLQPPRDVTKQSKEAKGETAFWSTGENKLVRTEQFQVSKGTSNEVLSRS